VIASLEEKLAATKARSDAIARERDELAFAALAQNDEKSRARLNRLHEEQLKIGHTIATIEGAIREGHTRLSAAEHAAQVEADKARALAIREVVARVTDNMKLADEHFTVAVEALVAANAGIEEIHRLGEVFPTAAQVKANLEYAIHTTIQTLPKPWWRDWLRVLSPLQRRTFAGIWGRMAWRLETNVRVRLGEAPLSEPEPVAPPPLPDMRPAHSGERDGGDEEIIAAHQARVAERRERAVARSAEIAANVASQQGA
jgi:hypothetical protein